MARLAGRRFKLLRKRPPRALQPLAVQVAYFAELKQLLRDARALVEARLLPVLQSLNTDHMDASRDPAGRVNRIMDKIVQAHARRYSPERLARIADRAADATDEHQRRQLTRQIGETISVPMPAIVTRGLRPLIKQFTAQNVGLIKTVAPTYFQRIEQRVLAGMRAGTRHEELAQQLVDEYGVAENRAKLIARDQVLSFQADLNQVRQRDLGVERYVWRTTGDNRVREIHAERDGQIYTWAEEGPGDASDPADGEKPGEGINCRCWADPYLEDLVS